MSKRYIDQQSNAIIIKEHVDEKEFIFRAGMRAKRASIHVSGTTLVIGGYSFGILKKVGGKTFDLNVQVKDAGTCIYAVGLSDCIVTASVEGSTEVGSGIMLVDCKNTTLINCKVKNIGAAATGKGYGINLKDCTGIDIINPVIENARYGVSLNGRSKNIRVFNPLISGPNTVAEVDVHSGTATGLELYGVRLAKLFNETWLPEVDVKNAVRSNIAYNLDEMAHIKASLVEEAGDAIVR
jgi:hypothetical protein